MAWVLPKADLMDHDRSSQALRWAKDGMLRWADGPAEPVTKLGLQTAGPDPNQQAALSPEVPPHSCSAVSLSAQQLQPLLLALAPF